MLRKGIITILCAMCSTLLHADNNIEFESEDLEKIVKEAIGIENRKVTSADIDRLVELKCYGSKVHSLKGLESAQNLETLVFTHSNISNISAIEELKKLKVVKLSFNNITNIASLQNHKNILELYLNHNVIKDISPLENLENLELLALQKNPLSENSFEKYLPIIVEKNPNATIYHDRVLTPEKAIWIARQVFRYGLIFICVLIIFVIAQCKIRASNS